MRPILGSLILLVVAAAPVAAQGWIEPTPGIRPDFGVVKLRTAVSVQVEGRIARVEVEEWFENRGGRLGEGDYLYPLPGEAVFSNFSLFQGDEELRGETMDADRARAIYEEIVRRRRDPALIELAGHGLIRARVFPINPGETRKITLRYTQLLARAGDALQFRYAAGGRTAGAPRPGVEGGTGPVALREQVPVAFEMRVDDAAQFRDPFSPTHDVTVTRRDARLTVRPTESLSGDFALFLPFARGAVGLTVATHRPDGEDGFFMLTLSPGRPEGPGQSRDLTAVVDVSGSMSGQKIAQAQAALRQLLGTMGPDDRFRLISFSSTVRSYRDGWSAVTPAALRDARTWIDDLEADGGTNIAGALREAFRADSPTDRLPIVLFLTDGLPSVGEQNPERIAAQAEHARGRRRVFAFGVGYDVNTYLLDRLSAAGRGATAYVEPAEDVEHALSAMAAKIQHPVLTELDLHGPVALAEIYPGQLPDLFAGEELVIFGRYRVAGRGAVRISGRRSGRTERYGTEAEFPARATGNDFIPRLWAARKIGALQQAVRLNGRNEELIEEIRQTALRYGLLSEYTSYLVQEPDLALGEGRGARGQPTAMSAAQMAPAASGAAAVASAKADRARREVRTAAELADVDEAMLLRGHFPQAQHAAGRVFVERDGVWTDLMHGDSLQVVRIAPFSPAYFELVRRLPELEPILSRFEQVLVAGRRISLAIVADGQERVSDPARVVQEFRGP